MGRRLLTLLLFASSLPGCAYLEQIRPPQNLAEAYERGRFVNWSSTVGPEDEEAVAWGRALYGQYCETCHGPNADGKTARGVQFKSRYGVAPPDLVREDLPDGRMMHAMTEGGVRAPMPSFQAFVTEYERSTIIAYLRHLKAQRQAAASSTP